MRLIASILLILTSICFSQDFWERTNGPFGGSVNCVEICPDGFIYAGTGGGIYISKDNGSSWNQLSTSSIDLNYVASITIIANRNIFVRASTGLFRSIDNGENWIQ